MSDYGHIIKELRGWLTPISIGRAVLLSKAACAIESLVRELEQEKKKVAAFQAMPISEGLCIECVLPLKVCTCPGYTE